MTICHVSVRQPVCVVEPLLTLLLCVSCVMQHIVSQDGRQKSNRDGLITRAGHLSSLIASGSSTPHTSELSVRRSTLLSGAYTRRIRSIMPCSSSLLSIVMVSICVCGMQRASTDMFVIRVWLAAQVLFDTPIQATRRQAHLNPLLSTTQRTSSYVQVSSFLVMSPTRMTVAVALASANQRWIPSDLVLLRQRSAARTVNAYPLSACVSSIPSHASSIRGAFYSHRGHSTSTFYLRPSVHAACSPTGCIDVEIYTIEVAMMFTRLYTVRHFDCLLRDCLFRLQKYLRRQRLPRTLLWRNEFRLVEFLILELREDFDCRLGAWWEECQQDSLLFVIHAESSEPFCDGD